MPKAPLLLLLLAACTPACDPTCDRTPDRDNEVDFNGGTISQEGTFYETGGWCDRWLHLPPQRVLRLHHGLGVAPLDVNVYTSFEELPFGDDCSNVAFTAPSAGNIVIGESFTEDFIQVRTDTCEPSFYLRLTATFPSRDERDGGL